MPTLTRRRVARRDPAVGAGEPIEYIEQRGYTLCLLGALVVASCLLFFRLSAPDPLTDEEELAFRAVGYVDFLNAPYQTTPYEWFERPPWWIGLSFHDHPPLVFLMEHAVFRLIGDSLFAVRLPFALLGLASLVLLGELARRLYDRTAACLVLVLAAVNTYWLWVFRLGLQEGMVIFFLLLGTYCLTRAPANAWWLVAWGIAAGLGMLTKYTSILIFPVGVTYLIAFAPRLLRRSQFVLGLLCAAILFSPVLIYNFAMLQAVGHFDLQFSALLRQTTPRWTILPGKAIGTIGERLALFLPNLWWSATWLFVLLFASSLLVMVMHLVGQRRRDARTSADAFVLGSLAITALLVLLVGPSQRFLALLIPFALLACGSGLSSLIAAREGRRARLGAMILLAGVVAGQALISFRTLHSLMPREIPSWSVSSLRYDSAAWGYGELEGYLQELLDTARPAVTLGLPPRLRFVESLRASHPRHSGGERRAWLIVYDPRMNNVAKLWLYDRRYFYDGWPMLSVDDYEEVKRANPRAFEELGITDYYYIAAEDGLFTAGNTSTSVHAAELQERLAALPPERVFVGPDGRRTFTVYHGATEF